MVYAGQERGMTKYRGPMAWEDGDNELTAYHRSLLAAHDDHAVLRRGTLADMDWRAPSENVVAFALEHEDERVVVALNFGSETATVTVDEDLSTIDLFSGDHLEVDTTSNGSELLVADAVAVQVGDE
jgi:hypothetical protein